MILTNINSPASRSLLQEHLPSETDTRLKNWIETWERRGSAVAKVAVARKLAVRMYWMLRSGADYAQLVRMQGSSGATLVD